MLALLAIAQAALPTRVFATDEEAIAWVEENDQVNRAVLPVLGPAVMARLEPQVRGNVRFLHVQPSEDPEARASDARLDHGSPCALVLAPLDVGWAGWTSGACGMLAVNGWRWERGRVLDGTDRPVMITAFAMAQGDQRVLATYKRLERVRSGALWAGMLGGGALFVSSISLADHRGDTGLRVAQIGSGVVTVAAAAVFAGINADARSHPQRLDAWYPEDVIRERVRAHNRAIGL
ncbi:MAG: hypothetical protein KC656_06495 [Myxococcales bacterium]|nr:hypothetical protein [Myxococcales bacterium]